MKKLLSILLSVLLVIGCISVIPFSAATQSSLKQAIEKYENESGEKVETNRYYFLMPDGSNGTLGKDSDWYFEGEFAPSWYNDNADHAGIYWWNTGKFDPEYWPGYEITKADSDSVYYADIPNFVDTIIFNNYLDGGMDTESQKFYDARQTDILPLHGYEVGDSETYPYGLPNFEDMIFVIDPDIFVYGDINSQTSRVWGGEWYYYYGNGCYGTVINGNETDCIRDDHDHENLFINFDPSNADWGDFEKLYCIIKPYAGSAYYPEKSVPALCTDYDLDGVYTYDLNKSKINLIKHNIYKVYFVTDTGKRTFELTMQTNNIKDTIYATGENHSEFKRALIKWRHETALSIPSLQEAVRKYEKEHNTKLETYRNYFYIPDGSQKFVDQNGEVLPNWFNEHYSNICISYNKDMCSNAPYPNQYPGFTIEQSFTKNVYYADIPKGVSSYWINNAVVSSEVPLYSSCISFTLGPEFNEYYGEGLTDCDNMIYVFDDMDRASMTTTAMCSGKWYYHLGGTCYSDTINGKCLNKDHKHQSVKEAVEEYEEKTGEKIETNRYYFLMPNGKNGEKSDDYSTDENGNYTGNYGKYAQSWHNEYSDDVAIYWWDNDTINPEFFPGYLVEKGDSDSIFYADVPKNVRTIIWSNNVTYSSIDDPKALKIKQTINIPSEYYDAGESPNYPSGVESFNKMIFVVDPDVISINDWSFYKESPFGGEWYYYYGDGCYGFVKGGDTKYCVRDDHYDDKGNHIEDILGDVDKDGTLSIMDATEIQMVLAQLKEWAYEKTEVLADFDNDGEVSVLDATAIQLRLAQL